MKRHDPLPPQDLARLLDAFFRRELPDELPPLRLTPPRQFLTTPQLGAVRSNPRGRFGKWVGPLLASAAALVAFLCTRLAWSPRNDADPPFVAERPADDHDTGPAMAGDSVPGTLQFVVEGAQPIEREHYYSDTLGPLELRTDMLLRSVIEYEPTTGVQRQRALPAWEIEIVPIRR